ncbi:MAG: hypothetical protein IT250_02340 [Chitinophagaceae bacterium]|nr:hypothetical protein [Chitinophagaceae bacterium]
MKFVFVVGTLLTSPALHTKFICRRYDNGRAAEYQCGQKKQAKSFPKTPPAGRAGITARFREEALIALFYFCGFNFIVVLLPHC